MPCLPHIYLSRGAVAWGAEIGCHWDETRPLSLVRDESPDNLQPRPRAGGNIFFWGPSVNLYRGEAKGDDRLTEKVMKGQEESNEKRGI